MDPAACKGKNSAYASICTASEHVSFLWVAKVTPGLEGKHPTYCRHCWEKEKGRKTDSEKEQTRLNGLWFWSSKCVDHTGMWRCLFPVQPCSGFYCPLSSSIKHILINWQNLNSSWCTCRPVNVVFLNMKNHTRWSRLKWENKLPGPRFWERLQWNNILPSMKSRRFYMQVIWIDCVKQNA